MLGVIYFLFVVKNLLEEKVGDFYVDEEDEGEREY